MNVDPDLLFVIGLVCGLLSIPALLSAFSESRTPRGAAMLIMLSGGLIAIAALQKPGGYSFEAAPDIIVKVISDIIG